MTDPRNRRRFPRLPVTAKVRGRWRTPSGEEQELEALLGCISEGGAAFRTAVPITANSCVRLTLRLTRFQVVEATGRVRWWRRHGEVREAGIEFREPMRRVGEWVERQLAREDGDAPLKPPATPTKPAEAG